MSPLNSSTFNSEPVERRRAIQLLGWIALGLVLLDILVGFAFAYPNDPKNPSPGKLAMYFDYGRSMEGRLARITRADPKQTAPITLSGWYHPLEAVTRPGKLGKPQITIYGMSHAVRLADALNRIDPEIEVRSVGAPGATTNWSYGAFLRDNGNRRSKVVVLAIMSSTLPAITTMSPLTWNSTQPIPYTQDRFLVRKRELRVVKPPFESFASFVATFSNQTRWNAAMATFKSYDSHYDAFLMRSTILDHSTLVRLLRRAYRQKLDREERNKVLDASHFDPKSEQVRVANAIVADFAKTARAQGQVPIIYVINNLGFGDQLTRALEETIRTECILALETDRFVSSSDPRNYLPDSHFTDANDAVLAGKLTELIKGASAPSAPGARSVPCTGRRPPRSL